MLRIRALGPLRISIDGRQEQPLTQARRVALLAYLALARPRGLHSRDTLLALLWPESNDEQSRQALRNALHAIRKALGEDLVITAGQDLVGLDAVRVWCDVDELESFSPLDALDRFAELLEGFHVSNAPEFERWLDGLRDDVRGRVVRGALGIADELHGAGDFEAALDVLRRVRFVVPDDPRVERRERDWARPASTPDPQAYVLYVRGTFLFLRAAHPGAPVEDVHRSGDLFMRALERDPQFSLAYAGLSNYYAVCAARGLLKPFTTYFGKAIELSHQALALDASMAIPHVHFGVQAMYLDYDWPAAEREFSRAVALDPMYAEARRFLAILLLNTGRRERGLHELRETVRVEPDMPMFHNSLADALLADGLYDEAIAELRIAVRLDPGYRAARERLVRCFERTERFADAVAERVAMNDPRAADFADALKKDGPCGYRASREKELRAAIASLETRQAAQPPSADSPADIYNPPELQLALAHAALGEWDEAFAWEQRGVARASGLQRWFTGKPELDALGPRRAAR